MGLKQVIASFCLAFQSVLAAFALVVFASAAVNAEELTSGLRYGFQKGTTLVYEVRIEAEQADSIEVYSGYPRYAVDDTSKGKVKLTFTGALEPSVVAKPDSNVSVRNTGRTLGMRSLSGIASPGSPKTSTVSIDIFGQDISIQGSSQLPYLLGNLSEMMIEPLPKNDEKAWDKSRELHIALSNGMMPRMMLRDENVKKLVAAEKTTYRQTKQEGDLVLVAKTYQLSTAENVKDKPRFEIAGKGTLTFDRRQGLFVGMTFEQTLSVREPTVARETPIKITYKLLDDAAVAKADAESSRSLNADELEAVLDDLKVKDKALGRILELQQKAPANPNPEVGIALTKFLESTDQNTRYATAKALEIWATAVDLPALNKAVADPFNLVRHSSLKALTRLKPEDALQPALKMLTGEATDRLPAVQALKIIGAPAEGALIENLKHQEWMIRLEAVRLLSEFGTEKSLAPLKPIKLEDERALLRKLAGDAIDAIQKRSK